MKGKLVEKKGGGGRAYLIVARTMAEIEAVRNLHLFDPAEAEFWVVF